MTDEQNARLNKARARAGEYFHDGDVHALGNLAQSLILESEYEALVGDEADCDTALYVTALRDEADMITESMRFLDAKCEAVAHG